MTFTHGLQRIPIPSRIRLAPVLRGVSPELVNALNVYTREVEAVLRAQSEAIKELQQAVASLTP